MSHKASAPGKIILFGEHAVVYGRPALAVPVTQVMANVEISDSARRGIWIDAPDIDLQAELNTLPSDHPLAAVLHNLLFTLGISPFPSLNIKINSTIPVAAGLGSGAAVSVALIRAFSAHLGQSMTDEEVNAFAFEIEKLHHGTPSGIDNTVVTYARPVYFVKGQPPETFKVGEPFTIVIGDTGIHAPTKESVGDVHKLWEADKIKWESVFDKVGEIAESARTKIESGSWQELGELMDQNHALLQEMTVSSLELDKLVQAARKAGALGAKLSGGGRGGNMIALVDPGTAETVVAGLKEAGARRTIVTQYISESGGVDMTDTADVLIIGAGVHGASLAFHLAQRGVKVIVLEKKFIAAGATGRSSGLVRMHYDVRQDTELAWVSFQYFRNWKEMVGGDCGFTRTGFIQMVAPADSETLKANVAMHQEIGVPVLLIKADDVKRLAPSFNADDIELAAYEPESGYAMPSDTATAMMNAARDKGARLVQDCAVTGIKVAGEKIAGVQTTQGEFSGAVVVNAAGAWAGNVNKMAGLDLPYDTWRHDTMFVARPGQIGPSHPTVIDFANEMYFRPEGNLTLVGLEDGNPLGESPDGDSEHAKKRIRRTRHRPPVQADPHHGERSPAFRAWRL